MPKLLCRFIVTAIVIWGLSSFLHAEVIYTSAEPNGLSSFTVLGNTVSFSSYSDLQYLKCPNMGGGTTPVDCSASNGGVIVQGTDGVRILGDGWAYELSDGDLIGPSYSEMFFPQQLMLSVEDDPYSPYYTDGYWNSNYGPGYLGFHVMANNGGYYGWALVEITGFIPEPYDPDGHFSATVLSYAYESCPFTFIAAGATSGGATCDPPDPPVDPTSEPATSALLLLGLVSLGSFYWLKDVHDAWRR